MQGVKAHVLPGRDIEAATPKREDCSGFHAGRAFPGHGLNMDLQVDQAPFGGALRLCRLHLMGVRIDHLSPSPGTERA